MAIYRTWPHVKISMYNWKQRGEPGPPPPYLAAARRISPRLAARRRGERGGVGWIYSTEDIMTNNLKPSIVGKYDVIKGITMF